MTLKVDSLDHLVINVTDVEVSAAWYVRVLGMDREDFSPAGPFQPDTAPPSMVAHSGDDEPPTPRRTSVRFGRQKINLRPVTASTEEWFTAAHTAPGTQDLCFLTMINPKEVMYHLRMNGVEIEAGPVPKRGARGTLNSVYCRDPDGNLIEISSYVHTEALG